jgi:hypothetical protein
MSGVISRFVVPDPADLFGSGSVVVDLTLYDGSDDVPAGPAYAHYADIAAGGAVDLFGVGQSPSGALSLRKSGELIAASGARRASSLSAWATRPAAGPMPAASG